MRAQLHRVCLASALVLALGACVATALADTPRTEEPETVLITFRGKPGSDEALVRVIAQHWETARRLKFLREDMPHITLRATDAENRPYFVEIFTWRDASIPDAAPPEILAIWKEMSALVEKRGTAPGLEIVQMTPVR
jgi:hypothetical protein